MKPSLLITVTWGALVLLTVVSALLGHLMDSSLLMTIIVAALVLAKSQLVINNFLEIGVTPPKVRSLVHLYVVLWPILMILDHLFGAQISALTQL